MTCDRFPEALSFDDVLILPQRSSVLPKDVDLTTRLTRALRLDIPLVSAAMDTVTEFEMALRMAREGGIGIIHRNMDIPRQVLEVRKVKESEQGRLCVGAAVGTGGDSTERAEALIRAGVDVLVVDTAHGHSERVLRFVERIKKGDPKAQVIAGNVGTAEAVRDLVEAGADGIKVGIGPGSICTTRIVAGVGVPQFSAILEAVSEAQKTGVPVIADGGIRFSGDIVKALAAGAECVMIGSLFAGTDESPGKQILHRGQVYKSYRGMGSLGAMQNGSADRYSQEDVQTETKLVPEGVEGMVPCKGTVSTTIHQLLGGLKSGMGYVGAKNVKELRKRAKFIRQTAAGRREGHVHDVTVAKEAPNYRSGQ